MAKPLPTAQTPGHTRRILHEWRDETAEPLAFTVGVDGPSTVRDPVDVFDDPAGAFSVRAPENRKARRARRAREGR